MSSIFKISLNLEIPFISANVPINSLLYPAYRLIYIFLLYLIVAS
jgi:hypothetical protein